MSEIKKKYQVFISSVFDGFREERSIATQSILKSKNIPIGMEQFPNGPEQWSYITELIDECDIFIVIVGNRYGSIASNNKGFVEKEYDYAVKRGLHPLAFYSETCVQEAASKGNTKELEALTKFINKIKKKSGITYPYTSVPELGSQILLALVAESRNLDSTDAGWVHYSKDQLSKVDKQKINQEVSSLVNPILQALSKVFFNANLQDKSLYKELADEIYQIFCNNLNDESSPIFIDIGYWLADIYERTNDFVKSANLANDIIKIIENQYHSGQQIQKDHIRKLIGCAYSIIIVKEKDYSTKLNLLSTAKPLLLQANSFLENKKSSFSNNEYLELKALWYSDYAALMTNYYDNDKSAGVSSKEDYLNESLNNHLKALETREKWLANLSAADKKITGPIEVVIAQSTSNIGGIYYRLGNFSRALTYQRNAFQAFSRLGEKTRAFATMGYIIGIYLKIWSSNGEGITPSEYNECSNYAAELAASYYQKKEKNKAKEVHLDKIQPLEKIAFNIPELKLIYESTIGHLPFSVDWYNE